MVTAAGASRQLGVTSDGLSKTIQRLATGQPSGHAFHGAAAPRNSSQFDADIRIGKQIKRNTNDRKRYLQTVDGALEEAAGLWNLAAETAAQASASSMSDANRAGLDTEFRKITSAIRELVEKTEFNGQSAFTATEGEGSTLLVTVRAVGDGPDLALRLSTNGCTLLSPAGAETAGLAIAATLEAAGTLRAAIRDSLQQLAAASNILGVQIENFTAICSQIRDPEIAEEIVNLTKFQVLNQPGLGIIGESSQAARQTLALIRKFQSDWLAFPRKAPGARSEIAG